MPVAYDNRRLIDGPGELIFKVAEANLATDALGTNTTTVLQMDDDPVAAGFRAGDVIKVGSEARKIAAVTATSITLEAATTSALAPGDPVSRVGIHAGYTQDGISVMSKTNLQERNADQSLDPVSVKADKRESSIKTSLIEIFGKSVEVAFAMDPNAVSVSGGYTTYKMGNSTLTLNTVGVLLLGSQENGDKVTVFASKCVNQGEASITFAKDKASSLPLDLRLITDSSRPSGEELFVMKTGPAHDFSYLL